MQANLHIKQAEAEQNRMLATQQQTTDSEIGKIQAQAKVNIPTLQADALRITTDAEVYNQQEKAKVLASSPQAMLMNFLKEFKEALTNGHFLTSASLTKHPHIP